MCDKCNGELPENIIKGVFYGLLKKILDFSPINKVLSVVDKAAEATIDAVVDAPSAPFSARKDLDIAAKSAIYVISSVIYEKYIYAYIKSMKLSYVKDMGGFCACEIMRNIYILFILQVYSWYMHGFKLKTLLSDIIAIFGTDYGYKLAMQLPAFSNVIGKKTTLVESNHVVKLDNAMPNAKALL